MPAFSVLVPGSSANLGSGFDSLAVALDCWLRVDLTPRDDRRIVDTAAPDLLGGGNLVIEALETAARRFRLTLPGCNVTVRSDIPVARGLGSSAAAIVAGICAAGVLAGRPRSHDEIIDLGGDMEGHADNISASVLGGITVSVKAADRWLATLVTAAPSWRPVVYVPHSHAFTSEARAILPTEVPMTDVVANVGRAALLVQVLHAGRADLLAEAMRDRLHQPYRSVIFRHLQPCIDAALAAGAAGAALSGAGPAVLAFAPSERAGFVAEAMRAAAAEVGVEGDAKCMHVPTRGLSIVGG